MSVQYENYICLFVHVWKDELVTGSVSFKPLLTDPVVMQINKPTTKRVDKTNQNCWSSYSSQFPIQINIMQAIRFSEKIKNRSTLLPFPIDSPVRYRIFS